MLAVMMPCSALGTGDKDTITVNDTIMTVAAENDKQISDTINKVVSAADSVSMRMLSANDSVRRKRETRLEHMETKRQKSHVACHRDTGSRTNI